MVGKYTGLSDAYLSVLKALQHACLAANRKLDVQWVEASHLEPAAKARVWQLWCCPHPGAATYAVMHAGRQALAVLRPFT